MSMPSGLVSPSVSAPNAADQTFAIPTAITTPSVANALEALGEDIVASMASALVQLMSLLAANTAIPTASVPTVVLGQNPLLPTNAPLATQTAQAIGAQTGLGGGLNTVIQPPQTALPTVGAASSVPTTIAPAPTQLLNSATSSASSSTQDITDKRRNAKPQIPGLGGLGLPSSIKTSSLLASSSLAVRSQPLVTSPSPLSSPSTPNLPSLPLTPALSSSPITPNLPSLGALPALPSSQILPAPAASAVGTAPVVSSAALPGAPGSAILSAVRTLYLRSTVFVH